MRCPSAYRPWRPDVNPDRIVALLGIGFALGTLFGCWLADTNDRIDLDLAEEDRRRAFERAMDPPRTWL